MKLQPSHPNAVKNTGNKAQGITKKVLCVCTGGLLRSPTLAKILSAEWGFNVRCAGSNEAYALIPISEALVTWADEIICTEIGAKHEMDKFCDRVHLCNIPDDYDYDDPELIELMRSWAIGKFGYPKYKVIPV